MIPVVTPWAASADQIADKRAEAARIQDQLDAQGEKVSVATEQFNRAQVHLQDVQDSLAKAQADLQRSTDKMTEVKSRLVDVAIAAYVQGGASVTLSRLARGGGDSNVLTLRHQYLTITAGDQQSVLGDLRAAKEDFGLMKAKLQSEEKTAKAASDGAAATRRDAVAAENAQKLILTQVQGELADLVSAEAARRLAAEAAKAPPPVQVNVSSFDDVPTTAKPAAAAAPAPAAKAGVASNTQAAPAVPPPSSKAGIAVQTAEAQVGKPYVYGGSGPDSFDCSGLTSYAWRAAGVSLSHDAYDQYFETTRIPLDSVQPGDLLFFGDNGVESIHHVAMYVGNGQMVEAAETGIPVRYRGWRASDLVGAGRPG